MKRLIPQYVKLWQFFVPLLLVADVLYRLYNIVAGIITLGFFLFAPGYLLLRRLHNTKVFHAGTISLSIGLSISLITVTGLVLNSLHYIGVTEPLRTSYIFIALNSMSLLLIGINWLSPLRIRVVLPRLKLEETLFSLLFAIFPLLAIGGAIRLNNGASNILTMILMGLISIVFIVLMLRPGLKRIYPYALFMTAISILLCVSLRGWYTTGHDIHHEFSVFSTTMANSLWRVRTSSGDPYNACLSITILPTILQKISGIVPIYIFKIVFQVIFAAMIPALYAFTRKFASEKKALLGVFAFITFPTFTNDMPFLNRQEIAFCYFILILFVNFSVMATRVKSTLTVILLLSMIFAHYSSSYATIGLLFVAYIFYKILSRLFKDTPPLQIPMLRLPIIVIALLAAFIWNAQITVSTGNLSSTLGSALRGLVSAAPEASSFGHYNLLSKAAPSTPATQFKQIAAQKNSQATYVPDQLIPLTPFGRALSKIVNVQALNTKTHATIAKILQLLVTVGTVLLFFKYRRKGAAAKDIYFLAFCMSCLAALVLFTFLPELSIGYDVTRLFQQSMMFLWLPVIIACGTAFAWLGRFQLVATAGVLVFLYINLAGLMPQLTGGFLPQLALNNSGVYYDYFYLHKSDVVATGWLTTHRLRYLNVFMDSAASVPPLPYTIAVGVGSGYPQGYYYTDFTNNNRQVYRSFVTSGFAEYKNPVFTTNKDLIYSNGFTEIHYRLGNAK